MTAGLVYGWVNLAGRQQQVQQEQGVDTSAWKIYRNEKYGFSFKYPPHLQIKVVPDDQQSSIYGMEGSIIAAFGDEQIEGLAIFAANRSLDGYIVRDIPGGNQEIILVKLSIIHCDRICQTSIKKGWLLDSSAIRGTKATLGGQWVNPPKKIL